MCSDPYNEYISGDPSGFRAIKAPVFQGEQLPDIKLYGLDGKLNNEKEHVMVGDSAGDETRFSRPRHRGSLGCVCHAALEAV